MTKLTKYSLSCCVQQSPDEPFEGEELPQMDRFPFGLDLGYLDVSSHINISSLPEGPVPGLVGKLMRMGSKFKKKLSVPDVIVYDYNAKVRVVIEVCTVVLYILLCTLIHYFGCNIFSTRSRCIRGTKRKRETS